MGGSGGALGKVCRAWQGCIEGCLGYVELGGHSFRLCCQEPKRGNKVLGLLLTGSSGQRAASQNGLV